MTIDVQNLVIRQNHAASRFEVELGDDFGVLDYEKQDHTYVFTHAEVPRQYRGQGIADKITRVALETAKAEQCRVVALCWFVSAYIKRHPEYQVLLAADS